MRTLLCLIIALSFNQAIGQDTNRVVVGVSYAHKLLDQQFTDSDESSWAGVDYGDMVEGYAQFRFHPNVFVGVEGSWFVHPGRSGYGNRSMSMILLQNGVDFPIVRLGESPHALWLGGQVEAGRTGGGDLRLPGWVWTWGGSVFTSWDFGRAIQVRLRGSFSRHYDQLENGSLAGNNYRIWGMHLGLQYHFWNR